MPDPSFQAAAIAADIALSLYQQPDGVPVPSADDLARGYGVPDDTAAAAISIVRSAGVDAGQVAGRSDVIASPVLTALAAAAISGHLADQDPDHEAGFRRSQERYRRAAAGHGDPGLAGSALQMLASGSVLAGPAARKFRWMTDGPGLTADQRRILAFEARDWRTPGEKAGKILEILEIDDTRYYQQLAVLIESDEAWKSNPQLVKRLRKRRDLRGGLRSGRGMPPQNGTL